MKHYDVHVQRPNFEHKGETVPNFVHLGTVQATDECSDEYALRTAQEVLGKTHAKALLCVTPRT